MRRSWTRAAWITVAAALSSCSSPTQALGNHVDFERALWLGRHPRAYSFEVAVTAFLNRPGYVRVQVSDGRVVDARDSSGQPIVDYALTIDGLWDSLLLARERGLVRANGEAHGEARGPAAGPVPSAGHGLAPRRPAAEGPGVTL